MKYFGVKSLPGFSSRHFRFWRCLSSSRSFSLAASSKSYSSRARLSGRRRESDLGKTLFSSSGQLFKFIAKFVNQYCQSYCSGGSLPFQRSSELPPESVHSSLSVQVPSSLASGVLSLLKTCPVTLCLFSPKYVYCSNVDSQTSPFLQLFTLTGPTCSRYIYPKIKLWTWVFGREIR